MTGKRPETGNLCFEDDWTGLFIRGDGAHAYQLALARRLEGQNDPFDTALLEGLVRLLQATRKDVNVQYCKPWVD